MFQLKSRSLLTIIRNEHFLNGIILKMWKKAMAVLLLLLEGVYASLVLLLVEVLAVLLLLLEVRYGNVTIFSGRRL